MDTNAEIWTLCEQVLMEKSLFVADPDYIMIKEMEADPGRYLRFSIGGVRQLNDTPIHFYDIKIPSKFSNDTLSKSVDGYIFEITTTPDGEAILRYPYQTKRKHSINKLYVRSTTEKPKEYLEALVAAQQRGYIVAQIAYIGTQGDKISEVRIKTPFMPSSDQKSTSQDFYFPPPPPLPPPPLPKTPAERGELF